MNHIFLKLFIITVIITINSLSYAEEIKNLNIRNKSEITECKAADINRSLCFDWLFYDSNSVVDIVSNIKKYSDYDINYEKNTDFIFYIYNILNDNLDFNHNDVIDGKNRFEYSRIETLKNNIYKKVYDYEFSKFEKLTGKKFYKNEDGDLSGLASLLGVPHWKPESKFIYSLEYMESLQTFPRKGILIKKNSYISNQADTAFLYTDKDFVDGQSLDEIFVFYDGIYSYMSNFGIRKIYSFKEFTTNSKQIYNGNKFYFYPNLLNDFDNSEFSNVANKFVEISSKCWNEKKYKNYGKNYIKYELGEYSNELEKLKIIISNINFFDNPKFRIESTIILNKNEYISFMNKINNNEFLFEVVTNSSGNIINIIMKNIIDNYNIEQENGEFILPYVKKRIDDEYSVENSEEFKRNIK